MGFFEDVELILGVFFIYLFLCSQFAAICVLNSLLNNLFRIFAGKVKNVGKVQTLLFSATLPDWVKHVCC